MRCLKLFAFLFWLRFDISEDVQTGDEVRPAFVEVGAPGHSTDAQDNAKEKIKKRVTFAGKLPVGTVAETCRNLLGLATNDLLDVIKLVQDAIALLQDGKDSAEDFGTGTFILETNLR